MVIRQKSELGTINSDLFETGDANIRFKSHLQIKANNRLVFSAKFGDGKTTFLTKFFEKEEKDFVAIRLFPVNYSVSNNEDIFELIKYDLLFSLLGEDGIFNKAGDTLSQFAAKYAKGNKVKLVKLFTPFIKNIPLLGDALFDSTERVLDGLEDFVNQYEKAKRGEVDIVESHLEGLTLKEGSIYEDNFYTQLIGDLVDRLSRRDIAEGNKRQTVLIIDDLDRIDPEHIFRILNVLAAHQDHHFQGNKFGFDKIIVVCDIDNIRHIFHHKYGLRVDFNGYIDKFYSVEVFNYSIKEIIIENVESILLSCHGNKVFENLMSSKTIVYTELVRLLKAFLKANIINVRNIIKIRSIPFEIEKYKIGFDLHQNVELWGVVLFNILKKIFGDYEELLNAFKKLRTSNIVELDLNSVTDGDRLSFILLPLMFLSEKVNEEASRNLPTTKLNTFFSIKGVLKSTISIYSSASIYQVEINNTKQFKDFNVDFGILYLQVYEEALNKGFLP